MLRLLRLSLPILALLGLYGQSMAMAMAPTAPSSRSAQASVGMDCTDMSDDAAPEKSPCKKMTWQCLATMGCAAAAIITPLAGIGTSPSIIRHIPSQAAPARLLGRSLGPEPDPPSIPI